MLKQKTKIEEIGGVKYRFSKMDARSASYMAMKAAAILAPSMAGGGLTVESAAKVLPNMSRAEFDEIQTMLLKTVCKLVETNAADMPMPIVRSDGGFVDEDLAYDAVTVMKLTANALMFNIGDFFQEAGSKKKPAKSR
jgi:energy-converting hydrogenase Eha subunit F